MVRTQCACCARVTASRMTRGDPVAHSKSVEASICTGNVPEAGLCGLQHGARRLLCSQPQRGHARFQQLPPQALLARLQHAKAENCHAPCYMSDLVYKVQVTRVIPASPTR